MSREPIVLATTNRGKLKEMTQALAGLPVELLSLEDIGASADVEENGRSFGENARLKSLAYSMESDGLTLAEDSGLEVEHLNGAPGIFSARFSAPYPTDEKNIRKVLMLMKNVPWDKRLARFICCLTLAKKGQVIEETQGRVQGRIALAPAGDRGFGYDPIFYYYPLRRTFGQLPPEMKNKVSHRGRALRKMRAFLSTYLLSLQRK